MGDYVFMGVMGTKNQIIIAEIGAGEVVGEIAILIDDKRTTATVVAIRDCELLQLDKPAFERFSQVHHH